MPQLTKTAPSIPEVPLQREFWIHGQSEFLLLLCDILTIEEPVEALSGKLETKATTHKLTHY